MLRWSSARAAPVAAALVVLVAVLATLAVRFTGRDDTAPGPPLGAVLDGADRRALGAVPVRRGPPPPPVDAAIDLADPAAVARAYLVGARTTRSDDGGRTHRQAAGYAAPGSPPAAVGVLVLDPPRPGQVRSAAVTALDLVARDDGDQRRGYRATVAMTTGPAVTPAVTSGGTAAVTSGGTAATAYVVLGRQPDGHWLVTADTPDLPDGDD